MQSDSTPDLGTTPDSRSITDLWRDSLELHGGERVDVVNEMYSRINTIVDQRNQATIRGHAHLEHPHLAWDEQAAVFTTGRFIGSGHTHDAVLGEDHTSWKATSGAAEDEGWAR